MNLALLNENIHEKYSKPGEAGFNGWVALVSKRQASFGNSDCMY